MNKSQLVGKSPTARAVCAATGNRDSVQGMIELAEAFTIECDVDYAARSLDRLASFRDTKIERCAMRAAGELIWRANEESEFLILVNQDHSRQRQNFSICHEFGHLIMPNYNPAQGRRVDMETMRWNAEEEEEYLCDVAAAEILMPRRLFRPRLRGCGLCIEALNELSEEFDTSLEATAINVVRTGLDDVAVIVWKWDYNRKDAASAENLSLFADASDPTLAPAEKKHRVKFAYSYGAMRDFYFPCNQSVDKNSLVAQSAKLLREEKVSCVRGSQILSHGESQSEFYTESYAYWTRKDGELEPKVITLVFLQQP